MGSCQLQRAHSGRVSEILERIYLKPCSTSERQTEGEFGSSSFWNTSRRPGQEFFCTANLFHFSRVLMESKQPSAGCSTAAFRLPAPVTANRHHHRALYSGTVQAPERSALSGEPRQHCNFNYICLNPFVTLDSFFHKWKQFLNDFRSGFNFSQYLLQQSLQHRRAELLSSFSCAGSSSC